MTTVRTRAIRALETVIAECRAALSCALAINAKIDADRLSVPKLDVTAIYATQAAAETVLMEIELRAGVAA